MRSRRRGQTLGEKAKQLERRDVRPVQILDHDGDAAARALRVGGERAGDRVEAARLPSASSSGARRTVDARAAQAPRRSRRYGAFAYSRVLLTPLRSPRTRTAARSSLDQPRLADAGLAATTTTPTALRRAASSRSQERELGRARDELTAETRPTSSPSRPRASTAACASHGSLGDLAKRRAMPIELLDRTIDRLLGTAMPPGKPDEGGGGDLDPGTTDEDDEEEASPS